MRRGRPQGLAVRRLVRRADFQNIKSRGLRCQTQSFVLQYMDLPEEPGTLAVGFTTSGALGNAVMRNRARRRLKAAFDEACRCNPYTTLTRATGLQMVIVGKMPIFSIAFRYLATDMKKALAEAGLTC